MDQILDQKNMWGEMPKFYGPGDHLSNYCCSSSPVETKHPDFLEFDKRSGKSVCSFCKVAVANNYSNLQHHAAGKKHLENKFNKEIMDLQKCQQ